MGKRSREDDNVSTSNDEPVSYAAESPVKIIDLDVNDTVLPEPAAMQCLLPPHKPVSFATTEDFDVHYAKEHTNRCLSCGKNFPSAHYLALHIDENHNPVREELAAKGEKTYACFIEDCEKFCSTPPKRRLHLIDKHMFPKGVQRRRLSTTQSARQYRRVSLLSADASVTENAGTAMEATKQLSDGESQSSNTKYVGSHDQVDELGKALAALKFVPPSVQAKQRSKKAAT